MPWYPQEFHSETLGDSVKLWISGNISPPSRSELYSPLLGGGRGGFEPSRSNAHLTKASVAKFRIIDRLLKSEVLYLMPYKASVGSEDPLKVSSAPFTCRRSVCEGPLNLNHGYHETMYSGFFDLCLQCIHILQI